jgi:hypothetical protein
MESIKDKQRHNLKVFMKQGAGLSYAYKNWIVAKNTKFNCVLIGGLGGMGVGEMWVKTDDRHRKNPEYKKAPEIKLKKDPVKEWNDMMMNMRIENLKSPKIINISTS